MRLAAAVVVVEGLGLAIFELESGFGPRAGGITATGLAQAAGLLMFVLAPVAGWQILRGRRRALDAGMILTTLICAGLLVVAAVQVYDLLRFFVIGQGDLPAVAVLKGLIRYQLPQMLPLFALTSASAVGPIVLLRKRDEVALSSSTG